jgi:hypothetical protein
LFIVYDEVFPLWCAAPVEHGGLGFSAAEVRSTETTLPQRVLETIAGAAGAGAQIGIAFSWTGVFLIFFTLALLPRRALCSRAFALLPCCVVS